MACHGVDIEIFSPLDYENVEVANAELIAKIKEIDYDMFMTCLNEEHLYYETLEQIKKYGIPTVLFCPDNLVAPFNHRHIANRFDLVWLTSIETEYLFKQWGCNTIFLPYAANPHFLTPTHSSEEIRLKKDNVEGWDRLQQLYSWNNIALETYNLYVLMTE